MPIDQTGVRIERLLVRCLGCDTASLNVIGMCAGETAKRHCYGCGELATVEAIEKEDGSLVYRTSIDSRG